MALVRGGLAALVVAVTLAVLPAGSAMAGTNIDTVAGGGTNPIDEIQAKNTTFGAAGVAGLGASGSEFVFTDSNGCRMRHVVASTSDTGLVVAAAGNGICGGGIPFTGGVATVPLRNPCCLSRLVNGGVLIADTDNGMVHRFLDGLVITEAGDSQPCGAIPDNVNARDSSFCSITDVAAHPTSPTRFLMVERRAQNNGGPIVYEVNTLAPNHLVRHVAGGGCPTPDNNPSPAEVCLGPNTGVEWLANGTGFVTVDDGTQTMRSYLDTDFDAGTTVTTVAGTANTTGGTGDNGQATAAKFFGPIDVARAHDGSFLVADYVNCRIRRVVIGGNVTHFAGATPDPNGVSACRTTLLGAAVAGAQTGDGGPATSGRIGHPKGIAVYDNGALIATDDSRIRLVDRTSILTAPPAIANTGQASFTFDGMDTTPSFRCKLDNQPDFACGDMNDKTESGTVPDGVRTMQVWEDGANSDGSDDATPARYTWTVDTQPPSTFALRQPADGATGLPPTPALSWDAASDATTGVQSYDVLIDGAPAGATPACADGGCSATPASGLSEGSHTWQIRATDKAGNARTTDPRTMAIGAPPSASFTAAPNPVLVGRSVTFSSTSADADGPIARHEWDLDGDGTFETDTGATPSATTTYAAPGSVPIALRVTDGVGLTATAALTLTVTNPPVSPGQLGVTVNNGAQYTNDRNVTINLKFPAGTTQVLISNDGGFLAPKTFTPAAAIPWTLDSSGPERLPKTVYVRFLLSGFASETFTDDIILDEIPPKVSSASVSPAAGAARASKVTVRGWDVKVKASDSNSGVDKLQVTADKKKPGRLLAYKSKLKVKSSARPKYLRARDRAGNFSKWRRLR